MNWKGFSSSFKKGFFNNKTHFNLLNSKINQNMSKINFSNKLYYTRILYLSNSYTLTSMLNNYQINTSTTLAELDASEQEASKLKCEPIDSLNILSELFLRESCKWTCTRLLNGPIVDHLV